MVVAWYKTVIAKQWATTFGLPTPKVKRLSIFNTQMSLKIPTNINLMRHLSPTKTYFWYIFILLYKKPTIKRYVWPPNLRYQNTDNLSAPVKSLNGYQNLGGSNHFIKYFFQQLTYFNFKPHRRVVKLQKHKILFRFWDSMYLQSLWPTRLINNYKFPFIYLKFYFFSRYLQITRLQVTSLLFLNSFQLKTTSL